MSDETAKHVMDVFAAGVGVASLANLLPNIAALLTIVWLGIRIYESRTFQQWLRK